MFSLFKKLDAIKNNLSTHSCISFLFLTECTSDGAITPDHLFSKTKGIERLSYIALIPPPKKNTPKKKRERGRREEEEECRKRRSGEISTSDVVSELTEKVLDKTKKD